MSHRYVAGREPYLRHLADWEYVPSHTPNCASILLGCPRGDSFLFSRDTRQWQVVPGLGLPPGSCLLAEVLRGVRPPAVFVVDAYVLGSIDVSQVRSHSSSAAISSPFFFAVQACPLVSVLFVALGAALSLLLPWAPLSPTIAPPAS